MPDQKILDQTALDYGVLVAGIKTMREEQAKIQADIDEAAKQRTMLNEEIAKAEEAKVRVRQELIQIEKEKAIALSIAKDELDAERRIVEDQRQKLAQGTKDLAEVEVVLNKRTAELEVREQAVKNAQNAIEVRGQALIVERGSIDAAKVELSTREELLKDRERIVSQKEMESEQRLRKALTAESNQKSSAEETKILALKASDDNLGAQSKLNEIRTIEESNQEALKQIKLFCDVAKEALEYMQNNVRNYDAIQNYFEEVVPALFTKLNHV